MYLPKFKQTPAYYTNGREYYNPATGEEYVGYYFLTSTQQAYSGKSMTRGTSILLSRYEQSPREPQSIIEGEYDVIKQDRKATQLKVTEALPHHTPERNDFKGYVDRYFAKNKATGSIIEISLETYLELKSESTKYHYPSYLIVNLRWHTTYPVDDMQNNSYIIKGSRTKNAEEVAKAEKVLPGISTYLVDLTELIS